MKVKVKGLVFVGFAAMIFAANAMAADNTVTSKQYVDTKFQTIANLATQGDETGNQLNSNSDTTYPSEKMVAAALEAVGGTVENGTLSITVNDTTGTFTANQSGNTTFSITGLEETANKLDGSIGKTIDDTTSTNEGTMYPSAKAVKDYVASEIAEQAGTDANTYQAKSTGTSVGITGGTWKALGDGTYTTVDDTGNSVTIDVNATADGTLANAGTGGTDAAKIPTANAVKTYVDSKTGANIVSQQVRDGTTATAPSEDAVYDFVGKGNLTVQLNGTQVGNAFGANQSADATINIDGVEVTSNKLTQGSATGSVLTTSDTQYPTSNAVKSAIEAATGNNTIPSMPSACSKDAPCVLTNSTADGSLVWVPIQQ